MRTSTSLSLAILTAIAQFGKVRATWSPDKAAQINFYTDTGCAAYAGEVPAWYSSSPEIGFIGSTPGVARAQCITLNMPGNSKSANTAALWGFSTAAMPGTGSGFCQFWDGFTCSGNTAASYYPTGGGLGPTCIPARSSAGFLWKSAKCYIN